MLVDPNNRLVADTLEHEWSLREFGVDAGTLDGPKPRPIRLIMAILDLFADLKGQVDSSGRHRGCDEFADRLINEPPAIVWQVGSPRELYARLQTYHASTLPRGVA
jgi:hypothetical protein